MARSGVYLAYSELCTMDCRDTSKMEAALKQLLDRLLKRIVRTSAQVTGCFSMVVVLEILYRFVSREGALIIAVLGIGVCVCLMIRRLK